MVATAIIVNVENQQYHYDQGVYYIQSDGDYTVVPPIAGIVVENLPEGGEETKFGDVTYVKVGETYYQPIEQDGKSMYEVVQEEEETT